MKNFDFNWCVSFLERHGKKLFGPSFLIRREDHPVIRKLLVYFLQLESEAMALGIDLAKGILLSGPVGCGKTALMTLMNYIPGPGRNYTVRPCRDVSLDFIQDGYEVIGRYSKFSYNGSTPKIYCFDDLGAERNFKYFGNDCNVMGEILLSRYDMFVSQGMVTHITTNLPAGLLEKTYGDRVRSRLREQMNLIAFEEKTPDKRGK
jgi:DNA replication protein DnaC